MVADGDRETIGAMGISGAELLMAVRDHKRDRGLSQCAINAGFGLDRVVARALDSDSSATA